MKMVKVTEVVNGKKTWFTLFVEGDSHVEALTLARKKYGRKGILVAETIDRKDLWLVTSAFDTGDAESGPWVETDNRIVCAKSEEEAVQQIRKLYAGDRCYCGAGAEPATEEDLKEYADWVEMESAYDDYREYEA